MLNYRSVEMIFSGLTAVGTVGTCVIAIVLALRRDIPRAEVIASYVLMVYPGKKISESPGYLLLKVTNIGLRSFKAINFYWRFGIFQKTHAMQNDMGNDGISSRFPINLNDGESASLYIPWEIFKTSVLDDFHYPKCKFIVGIHIYFWKITAASSIGRNFTARLNRETRRKIVELLVNESQVGHQDDA